MCVCWWSLEEKGEDRVTENLRRGLRDATSDHSNNIALDKDSRSEKERKRGNFFFKRICRKIRSVDAIGI